MIAEGTGVSETAALVAINPDMDLAVWEESNADPLRRAIADDEEWLASPPDQLHPAMRRALPPILADLARTGGPEFHFKHEPVELGANPMVVANGTGIWVDPFSDDEMNIGLVADAMHDAVIEATRGAWPACSLHPGQHPLVLWVDGWTCRVTGELVAALGELGA